MRYHVLGVGSIGSLIAFHLKRSIKLQRKLLEPGPSASRSRRDLLLSNLSNKRPSTNRGSIVSSLSLPPYVESQLPDAQQASVTLHLRKRLFGKQAKQRYSNSIVVERDGVRDIEGGFQTDYNSGPSDVIASIVRKSQPSRDANAEEEDEQDRFSISRSTNTSSSSSDPYSTSIRDQTTSPNPIPDHDGGVSLISTLEGVHSAPRASPIDSLIVTTKCDATLSALESIVHRIHPWSTIVLLQNGMGVLDTLNERLFNDPSKRPNFILASTTHGCWRKGPLDVVHASQGSLHFGIVPSPRAGALGFETTKVPFSQAIAPAPSISELPLRPPRKIAKGWEQFAPQPSDMPSSQQQPPPESQDPNSPSDLLSIDSIPDQPSLRTLKATVATLLSLPLDVHWECIRDFQLRALRKLVINACINPITALADCKNGDLFGSPAAMDAMWSVCVEAGMVLEAQVREYLIQQEQEKEEQQQQDQDQESPNAAGNSSSSITSSGSSLSTADLMVRSTETGRPVLNPSLTPKALFQEVQRVVRLTAANWSSMHSDIRNRRGSTEIDFINGYISGLGRGYAIDTTANDMLTSLIKLKTNRVTGTGRL